MKKGNRELYRMKAEIVRALGHEVRLAILDFLKGGEQCVTDIAEHTGSTFANASRHLSHLKKAGIVDTRKEGLNIYYYLKIPCIMNFFACIDNVLDKRFKQQQKLMGR
jgi:DNA-binding transcriptional ArsR family regulator